MSEEGEIRGRLTLDSGQFRADLAAARAALDELTATRTDVNVRADSAGARRELGEVRAEADRVGRLDPTIRVRTSGTRTSEEELRRLAEAADRLDRTSRRSTQARRQERDELGRFRRATDDVAEGENLLDEATRRAARSGSAFSGEARKQADAMAMLLNAAISLAPALIPIAAGATGIAGALGGIGAAGLLAGTGIARGMKTGEGATSQYRPVITQVLDDIHRLQDTAAIGVLPGVETSLQRVQTLMPTLNRETTTFSGLLGRILPTGVDAVATALERAEPLLDQGGDAVVRFFQALDQGAHSDQFGQFLRYAQQNLPEVEHLIGDALHLAGDVLARMAPYGGVMLHTADSLIAVADALTPIAPLIWATWTAFAAWRGATSIIGLVRAAIEKVGAAAGITAAETTAAGEEIAGAGATAEAGWAGVAGLITGAGIAAGIAASGIADAKAADAVHDETYKNTKGTPSRKAAVAAASTVASVQGPSSAGPGGMAIPFDFDHYADGQRKAAASSDATTAAERRQAAAAQAAAAASRAYMQALSAQITAGQNAAAAEQKQASTTQSLESAQLQARDGIDQLAAAVKANGTALDGNSVKARANREAVLSAVSGISAYGEAMIKSGSSANDARIAQDKMAISLENQLVKLGMNKTAVSEYVSKLLGIPKNSSVRLDLKSAEAIQGAGRAARAAKAFAAGDYRAALKADPGPMKAKVAEAQHAADQMAQKQYEAFLKANPANAEANTADAARKARSFAAGAYSASIRADAAQAIGAAHAAASAINAIHDKTVTISMNTVKRTIQAGGASAKVASNAAQHPYAYGGTAGSDSMRSLLSNLSRHAYGTVSGPGSASSDSVLTWLSRGEEVVSNIVGQASRNRPMLKAINTGNDSLIRRTAAEQYGSAGQQHVIVSINGDDSALMNLIGVQVERKQASQSAANRRSMDAGWRRKGLLSGVPVS